LWKIRVPILLDSDSIRHMQDSALTRSLTLGLGLDLAICTAEALIQVYHTSNIKKLQSETAIGLPLTRYPYVTPYYQFIPELFSKAK
jgi:hypothetical protein